MPIRKILAILCITLSTACLVGGYAIRGMWIGIVAVGLVFLAWLSILRWQYEGISIALLIVSVCLAGFGLMNKLSAPLMICSATMALASWDLVLFNHTIPTGQPAKSTTLLEKVHLEYLGLAIGLGLLLALAGRTVQIQIPFIVMVILVVVVLFSLERVWRKL